MHDGPRRIGECWCCMTGVSPSDLMQEINQWQEAYEKLQSEKMELVEVLKEIIKVAQGTGIKRIARAALAKAGVK